MHCLLLRSATLSVMTAVNCGLPMSDVHAYCWSGGTKLLHQDLRVECPSNKMVSITNLDNLDSSSASRSSGKRWRPLTSRQWISRVGMAR